MSVWQAEARHGGDDPWDEHDDERRPRHAASSPRERFTGRVSMPTPVSPAFPPALPPPGVHMPVPAIRPTHLPDRRPTRSPDGGRVTTHGAGSEEIPEERHYLATFGWTAAWYTVPVAIFAAWSLTFPADPGTACARPTANACLSPRAAALVNLVHGLPRVGVALAIALLVAGLIRLGSAAWRPVTVGFSAAIIGAGVATVLYSVLSSGG